MIGIGPTSTPTCQPWAFPLVPCGKLCWTCGSGLPVTWYPPPMTFLPAGHWALTIAFALAAPGLDLVTTSSPFTPPWLQAIGRSFVLQLTLGLSTIRTLPSFPA